MLEYKREFELRQASRREEEIRQEYETILKSKDSELQVSRDQVNQLLRIIEQMTKSKQKDNSTVESKGSSTARKNSSDDNRIVIQERLEISDESVEKLQAPSDRKRKGNSSEK